MNFAGLQKATLLDYPGKIAATAFTYGCNFRCPFCHNPELVIKPLDKNRIYTEDGILNFLKNRTGKLDALVISGGEPLLHENLSKFILRVKSLNFLVKIDTNGSFPEIMQKLINSGNVDYWAMDIKNSESAYFRTIGGRKVNFEKIENSIELIMNCGADYEFRTTVVPGIHDGNSIKGIGRLINGAKRHYIQNFHPNKTVDPSFGKLKGFSDSELKSFREIMNRFVESVEVRG